MPEHQLPGKVGLAERKTEVILVALAFLGLALLWLAFPQIDLEVSASFYQGNGLWPALEDKPLQEAAYRYLPRVGQLFILVLFILWVMGFFKRFPAVQARRRWISYVLLAALLGPILIVDVGLKGHFGRARPNAVTEFAGDRQFTPAFVPARQCDWNCSFVSGHVATAAFVMAFGWLGPAMRRRRWLMVSVFSAAGMGWVRLSVGAHFLSDVVFAWFFIYFSLWLSEWLFYRLRGENWMAGDAA